MSVDTTYLGKLTDEVRAANKAAEIANRAHKAELIRVWEEELAEYHHIARIVFEAFSTCGSDSPIRTDELVEWSEKTRDILIPHHDTDYYLTQNQLREISATIKGLRRKIPHAIFIIKRLLEKFPR